VILSPFEGTLASLYAAMTHTSERDRRSRALGEQHRNVSGAREAIKRTPSASLRRSSRDVTFVA
jgi:hypothetical protein